MLASTSTSIPSSTFALISFILKFLGQLTNYIAILVPLFISFLQDQTASKTAQQLHAHALERLKQVTYLLWLVVTNFYRLDLRIPRNSGKS